MVKIAIYLRKSREDEELEKTLGEGATLLKHRSALMKYAKAHDYAIAEVYEEIVSGEKLIYRPEMLRLLQDVEKKLYDGVLVMDMQRLGRGDMQDQGLILSTFKNSGTKIITLNKVYDLNNEFDEEYSEFEAFMSRKEYKMITRRMQGGRVRSVQEGNYIATRPPYGYDLDAARLCRTLKPNPWQSEIVKLIFNMYIDGTGSRLIAAHLNTIGVKSYTGKSWESSAVLNILKNPVYIGKVVWKKKCIRKSATPGKKKDSYTRRESEWIVAEGKHPAIITEEIFKQANEILKKKYHVPYHVANGLKNPLAGIVYCSVCGGKMMLRPAGKKASRFMCTYGCRNVSTKFSLVEERIIKALGEWLDNYEYEAPKEKKHDFTLPAYKRNLQSLERELQTLKSQSIKIHDLLEQGIYTVSQFLERSENISLRIKETETSLQNAKDILEKETCRMSGQNYNIPQIRKVLDIYWDLDAYGRNEALKSIIEKAEYYRGKGTSENDFTINIYTKLAQL